MSKGIKKKIHRNNKRVEENEVKNFDKAYARIIQGFNDFMFGNADGSFIEFDTRYRELASKKYQFIKPDKLEFYKFAIENDGTDIHDYIPKFNFPISFEKAPNTRKV